MSEYPEWNPTPRSAITWNIDVQNVDRIKGQILVEATEYGGTAAQAARVEICERLECGLQVPDVPSVYRIMALKWGDVRKIAHTHAYVVFKRVFIWHAD